METDQWPVQVAQVAAVIATVAVQVVAAAHAILHKRDSRAAVMWTALIILSPIFGALAYFMFGVNRIRRRAAIMRSERERPHAPPLRLEHEGTRPETAQAQVPPGLRDLDRLISRVVNQPLLPGNRVDILENGDEAYPAMLEAITNARHTISLSTYIFDNDPAGRRFVDALAAAVQRGVKIRVLIDDVGARYSRPSMTRVLARRGIPVARFHPRVWLMRFVALNLRNHRKILVVDGRVGFTGGMNIRHGHCLKENPSHPVQDTHFRVEGPLVGQLQQIFVEDWQFVTGELLEGEDWFPPLEPCGNLLARAIPDGPDEDFEKLPLTLQGAVACADSSILVATPYFLPDRALVAALNVAAMRGVQVDIVLPSKNNLPFVHWASQAGWWQVLERGCRIWLTPPPFDHSKVMVVDHLWSLIGSGNWDPRSFRLNFELNVEVYGNEFAAELERRVRRKMQQAHQVTLEEVDSRSLPVRLRDGLARLATPFL